MATTDDKLLLACALCDHTKPEHKRTYAGLGEAFRRCHCGCEVYDPLCRKNLAILLKEIDRLCEESEADDAAINDLQATLRTMRAEKNALLLAVQMANETVRLIKEDPTRVRFLPQPAVAQKCGLSFLNMPCEKPQSHAGDHALGDWVWTSSLPFRPVNEEGEAE